LEALAVPASREGDAAQVGKPFVAIAESVAGDGAWTNGLDGEADSFVVAGSVGALCLSAVDD
jgi:hypothetical protein